MIVQGVQGTRGAMGFFGFTYFEENAGKLKALSVGGVKPSAGTVQDGTYTPLGRQVFIYPSKKALDDKPEVKAFVDFYVNNIDQIVEDGGFIGLNAQQKDELTHTYEDLVG